MTLTDDQKEIGRYLVDALSLIEDLNGDQGTTFDYSDPRIIEVAKMLQMNDVISSLDRIHSTLSSIETRSEGYP